MRIFLLTWMLAIFYTSAQALNIPKGTFFFDNSKTKYSQVKFVYGSDSRAETYVVSMTDEGNDRWSITMEEEMADMYRYTFANTTLPDGRINATFISVKDDISNNRGEYRTATTDATILVDGIFTPYNNDNWAQGVWLPLSADPTKPWSGTLPVLFINTPADGGGFIPITSKEEYVSGTYYIDALGLNGYESLGSKEEPLALQIKGRGNYTWRDFEKKPYRLKFDVKASPLGMKKSKHFTLLAHPDDDLGFLRNTVGFEISRQLGADYTPSQEPVEVVLNGDYIGLYFLTDHIRVDKDRVNIVEQNDYETDPESITGGWIVEIDNYMEDIQVRITEGNGVPIWFTPKSPELLSYAQVMYLTNLVTDANTAIYATDKSSTKWEEYIDMEALARIYICRELMDDGESFHGSCYFHKDRGYDTKIIFGPVWDFGNAFRRGFDKFIYQDPPFTQTWIGEIAKFPRFQQCVKKLWRQYYANQFNNLEAFIDDFADKISAAAVNDARRWPAYGNGDMAWRKQWFKDRFYQKADFLRRQWGEGNPDATGISTLSSAPTDSHWYTLDGIHLTQRPTQKGIYICNGKKIVVR